MRQCTSEACSQGRKPCPTPAACEVAEQQRQFHPDYGIEGPYPPPIVVPWWLAVAVFLLTFFSAGAIGRYLGVL